MRDDRPGVLAALAWLASGALLLFAPTLPARADVPMAGTFLATAACPAQQSFNKGTNPGNVALTPQQTYELVSANASPPSHYLVIVPGASPERRWVGAGCGNVLASSNAVITLPSETPAIPAQATAPASAPPALDTSGHPTHFVLSLSWEPGFCADHADKPECRAATSSSFAATHFTLHGLWPDPREYCGAANADIAADKRGDWSSLPAPALAADTRTRLDRVMPGTQSMLERHEWLKHGTCSGASADAYFSRALGFVDAVNASPVAALFAGRLWGTLSLDEIRAAFDKALGADAGERIRLSCEGPGRRITEITVGLDGDVMGGASLATLIAAAGPTNGGCNQGVVAAVP